ncbi:hypothetical protein TorRG33x02_337700, partial [Trema orientale]
DIFLTPTHTRPGVEEPGARKARRDPLLVKPDPAWVNAQIGSSSPQMRIQKLANRGGFPLQSGRDDLQEKERILRLDAQWDERLVAKSQ